jgi:hypothetical protein
MNVSVTATPPTDLDADLLLIPLTKDPSDAYVDVLSDALGDAVRRAIGDFEGDAGESLLLYPENLVPRYSGWARWPTLTASRSAKPGPREPAWLRSARPRP